jgi:hypothetical protein
VPAGGRELGQRRVAHRQQRREQEHRHDRQAIAELGGLLQADLRGLAGRDDVQQARPLHAARDIGDLVERPRRLDERDVGARRERAVRALDRLVEAENGARVRARDQHEVGVGAVLGGGAHLADELVGADHLLVVEVPAALREHLVLDVEGGDAGGGVLAHCAHDVELVAEAGVGVRDHRHADRGGDARRVLRHLGHRQQPVVGVAEAGRRAGAGHVDGGEAGLLDDPGGQAVVRARGDDERVAGEQLPQSCCARHDGEPSAGAERPHHASPAPGEARSFRRGRAFVHTRPKPEVWQRWHRWTSLLTARPRSSRSRRPSYGRPTSPG